MCSTLFLLVALSVCLLIQISMCDPRVLSVYQSFPSSRDKQVEYDYRYAIDDGSRSGVVSDRWEQRIGEFVKGAYSLLEPSGKVRTVNYEVDGKQGFHATVKTTYPANVLLSNQQLEKYHRVHPEPLINLHTRRTSPPPSISQLYKDPLAVPPNYHAIMAAHAHPQFTRNVGQTGERRPPVIRNNNADYYNANSDNNNYYYTSTSLQPPPPQFSNSNNRNNNNNNNNNRQNYQRLHKNNNFPNRRTNNNYFQF